jgi:hypothetical protein
MRVGEIAVYFQIHTKHVSVLCGQNANFLDVQAGGIYNDHFALKV